MFESRAASGGVLLGTCAGVVVPFAPGLISADTNVSLYDAQLGEAADWYTPFGSLVWGSFMELGLGLGSAFAVQTAIAVLALYAILRVALRRLPAALGTAAICAFPPSYAQLSNLSRDTAFVAFTLLAFACYAHARRASGRRTALLLVASVAAAVVAFLFRQNAIAVVAVLSIGAFLVLLGGRPLGAPIVRRLPAPAAAVLAGLAVTALIAAVTQVAYTVLPVTQTRPERNVLVYDLAALTDATGEQQFPRELGGLPRGVVPPDISERTISREFEYQTVLSVYPGGDWDTDFRNEALAKEESRLLRSAWRDAVLDHPMRYATSRLRLTAAQLGFVRRPRDAFRDLEAHDNWGHPIEFPRVYEAARGYIHAFTGRDPAIPLDLPWVYLVMATAAAAFVRRSSSLAPLAAVMTAALWTNVAVLALTSTANDFRYMSIFVPAALVLAILAVRERRAT